MAAFSTFRPFAPGSKFVAAVLGVAALSFAATASASMERWDYVTMCDHDAATGQEVGYLMLHVDLPITAAGASVVSTAAGAPVVSTAAGAPVMSTAARASVMSTAVAKSSGPEMASATDKPVASPTVLRQAEQTVLSALSGEGDFDQAVRIVAAQANAVKQHLPGLADFLLARQTGDMEGFKQWTLTSKALQVRATADDATGATVVTYKRMVAELRVQIKLGPDYRSVIAGLDSARGSNFNAAIDRVIRASTMELNGGIDYGSYVTAVLKSLKSRAQPVPYTQRSQQLGITNSVQ